MAQNFTEFCCWMFGVELIEELDYSINLGEKASSILTILEGWKRDEKAQQISESTESDVPFLV